MLLRAKRGLPACFQNEALRFQLTTAWQQDMKPTYTQPPLAPLPGSTFTSGKPREPHGIRTWNSFFGSPLGTATPKRVYTRQAARTAWQQDMEQNFSRQASRENRMASEHGTVFCGSPLGTATPNLVYTRHAARTAWQHNIEKNSYKRKVKKKRREAQTVTKNCQGHLGKTRAITQLHKKLHSSTQI